MTEPAAIIQGLTAAGATVATAESLTGGRLAARLTETPGASAAFVGGIVSYATEVKTDVLGVPTGLVAEHGVVSEACARAMAERVRDLLGTTYGLSTTGVAGPDTQEGHPVGTVYVGIAGPSGTEVRRLALDGDRSVIQIATVSDALSALGGMMEAEARSSAGRAPEHPGLG
ncbi:CinA family protein [Nocardioides stalactiti]|uniref:CinA family protein n=1 Tax=Nocardioides stalactiti TaxID=2755356 RepID=UPI001601A2D9|nr:CinA family protein [Nocardioides stalactiti]